MKTKGYEILAALFVIAAALVLILRILKVI